MAGRCSTTSEARNRGSIQVTAKKQGGKAQPGANAPPTCEGRPRGRAGPPAAAQRSADRRRASPHGRRRVGRPPVRPAPAPLRCACCGTGPAAPRPPRVSRARLHWAGARRSQGGAAWRCPAGGIRAPGALPPRLQHLCLLGCSRQPALAVGSLAPAATPPHHHQQHMTALAAPLR